MYIKRYLPGNWLHMIVRLASAKSCRVSQQVADQERCSSSGLSLRAWDPDNQWCSVRLKGPQAWDMEEPVSPWVQCPSFEDRQAGGIFLTLWKASLHSVQVFSWLDEAHHIVKGNLLSPPTNPHVSCIQRCSHWHNRIMVEDMSGYPKVQLSWHMKYTITFFKCLTGFYFQSFFLSLEPDQTTLYFPQMLQFPGQV